MKMETQYNGHRKGLEVNDRQNISQKTKDWATRIPLEKDVNSGAPKG
jgi:hypothetical protein